MKIAFFAEQLYYLPQFTPVIRCLLARGHEVCTLVRLSNELREVALPDLESLGASHRLMRVGSSTEAYDELRRQGPQWAVFGSFLDPEIRLHADTKTALVYHGIGVKTVLFDPRLNDFDLRCVESQRVLDELLARDPAARDRLELVGYAKLDPLFALPSARRTIEANPTVLYAPTFYPSSLELMPSDLAGLLPTASWIVKPHFFSWTVPQYTEQRRRLIAWRQQPGVEVLGPEAYDLVPLMKRADILVSDASSALFEFAALGRPVVWCRFLKLRWSYRGLLRWRFNRRIDPNTEKYEAVAHCVDQVGGLSATLASALTQRRGQASGAPPQNPQRESLIEHLIGQRDGRASERIADALERRAARAPLRARA